MTRAASQALGQLREKTMGLPPPSKAAERDREKASAKAMMDRSSLRQ